MTHSLKTKIKEKTGFKDTFMLRVKMRDHETFRVVATNRNVKKFESVFNDLKDKITFWEIIQMDGITGEFKLFHCSEERMRELLKSDEYAKTGIYQGKK